jgi:hypothetical protein
MVGGVHPPDASGVCFSDFFIILAPSDSPSTVVSPLAFFDQRIIVRCELVVRLSQLTPFLLCDYYYGQNDIGKGYRLFRYGDGEFDDTDRPSWYMHRIFCLKKRALLQATRMNRAPQALHENP